MKDAAGQTPGPADAPRILLLVTTRKDAEISQRLLLEVGLSAHSCQTLKALEGEIRRGASALLTTEEAVRFSGIEALAKVLQASNDGLDLPIVVLTQGGTGSAFAKSLLAGLQNLTILERPAPVNSILSAVQSAVRVNSRQRQVAEQMARILDLQAKLAEALEASELGTFYCAMPLDKIIWNDQCKAHFWLPPEAEIDFDRFYSILHPDDRERTREAVMASVSNGEKYDIEYRTVSPSGAIRWVRATGQTQRDDDGQPLGFSGTTQDITARKLWEQEREQLLASERAARIEGERANRLKDEFLATLGHELRTPLNAITGWLELLRLEANDPATIQEGVEVIERNVRAQAQLIDDLLDVSRIISGKVRLEIKSVVVEEVVRAAIETVRPLALEKGVLLDSSVQAGIPAISADFGRLQQVVWNLLTNAVKFTPRGGEVRVLAEMEGATLVVAVSDTGEGIEPDFLPHVFERFRQADGSPSRQHSGLGLGLSIVDTLIQMHGGQVAAHSPGKGKGSTFEVRLPLALGKLPGSQDPFVAAPPRFAAETVGRPDLAGVRILVVDDEPDARTMMHRLLETCHATSMEADGASSAMRQLSEGHPDLILSDIGMPGTDGYQFINEVRRQGYSTPAVALTAFARAEDKERALKAGFNAHLAKPIEAAELLSLVASMTGRVSGVS
jgi:signal transduction histidine kinase/FixJ family two-component response regulator